MSTERRRAVGAITMLLGMAVALTLVLAACVGGQVDKSQFILAPTAPLDPASTAYPQ